MSLNFFKSDCQEPPYDIDEFGLCDDGMGTKAYTNTSDKNIWIANVLNHNNIPIVFTAIDKCVLFDDEYKDRGRCDGMLTTEKHLYLVELKNQEPPWQTHAINQLESTILFLKDNHDISKFRLRKTFAYNKKRDKFIVIDNEFNKQFFTRTSFRIDVQSEIVIV